MKWIKGNRKIVAVIVIATLLALISIWSLWKNRITLGVDFADAQVVIIQLDHEETVDTVAANAAKILKPDRVEKESTSKFYLYYQNLSDAKQAELKSDLGKDQNGIVSIDSFYFSATKIYSLNNRAIAAGVLLLIVYIAYLATLYKGMKLKLIDLLSIIKAEIITQAWLVLVMLGGLSLLTAYLLKLNNEVVAIWLAATALTFVIRFYEIIRFKELETENLNSVKFEKTNLLKHWPEIVLIFCIMILLLLLPVVVWANGLVYAAALILLALLFSLGAAFYLKPLILIGDQKLIAKLKFLQKIRWLNQVKW